MARFELSESNHAVLGEGPVNDSTLLDLGMMYSVGRSVPIDYVTAHSGHSIAAASCCSTSSPRSRLSAALR